LVTCAFISKHEVNSLVMLQM